MGQDTVCSCKLPGHVFLVILLVRRLRLYLFHDMLLNASNHHGFLVTFCFDSGKTVPAAVLVSHALFPWYLLVSYKVSGRTVRFCEPGAETLLFTLTKRPSKQNELNGGLIFTFSQLYVPT